MTRAPSSSAARSALVATLAALALAVTLPSAAEAQRDPDFLFGSPTLTVSLKGGYAQARAGSDLFDFVLDSLTLETSDFAAPALGIEVAYRLNERFDLALDVTYAESESASEFENWVDMDERPIEQTTTFRRIPVTLSLKGYLWERGRSVGRFAWIPRQWTPYAGVGGGLIRWEFTQEGDFVDFDTFEIFRDHFNAEGTEAVWHVLAGVQWSLGHRFALTAEGRYTWAEGEMDGDYQGFEPIDLSGYQLTVGVSARLARPGGGG